MVHTLLPVIASLWCCSLANAAKTTCAYFRFPTLSLGDVTLSVKEHALLTLPFSLVTDACPALHPVNQDVYVYVAPPTPTAPDFCVIHLVKGCVESTGGCRCGKEGEADVVMMKNVTRDDSGVWVWRTDGTAAEITPITINVQHSSDEANGVTSVKSANEKTSTLQPDVHRTVQEKTREGIINTTPDLKQLRLIKTSDMDHEKSDDDEKKTNDEGDNSTGVESPVIMAVIVSSVNVITIAVIVIVVVKCRGERAKARSRRNTPLPPIPTCQKPEHRTANTPTGQPTNPFPTPTDVNIASPPRTNPRENDVITSPDVMLSSLQESGSLPQPCGVSNPVAYKSLMCEDVPLSGSHDVIGRSDVKGSLWNIYDATGPPSPENVYETAGAGSSNLYSEIPAETKLAEDSDFYLIPASTSNEDESIPS